MPDARQVGFVGIGAVCAALAPPAVALAAGLLFAVAVGNPWPKESAKVSKTLLQACVVLLGFGMQLSVVLKAGREGFLFAAASIAATLVLGAAIGRLLALDRTTSILVSVGTAICGGSAIAAVGAVIGAAPAEMAVAVGTVFVLNALALYAFPPIGHALALSPEQFGVWAGIAIHDVSSVVGAATAYGDAAIPVATAVKLSRALWIVPLALGAARWFRKDDQPVAIPWFIGGFLLASVIGSAFPGFAPVATALHHVAKAGLSVVLYLIGAGLSLDALRSVGWRAFAMGVALWAFISVAALGLVW